MGFYADHVVPRVLDVSGGVRALRPWRRRVCDGLTGTVVEIGFGAGHNLAFYPPGVDAVVAVEPSDLAWRLAERRVRRSPRPVTRAGRRGESVPLATGSCDAALSTFTLCSVGDPTAVLAEVTRLLRPGAEVHFLEHGRSSDERVTRWQRRLEPMQRRLFDGCHLTRDPLEMMAAAGLEVVWSDTRSIRGPRPWTYLTVGVARTPL